MMHIIQLYDSVNQIYISSYSSHTIPTKGSGLTLIDYTENQEVAKFYIVKAIIYNQEIVQTKHTIVNPSLSNTIIQLFVQEIHSMSAQIQILQ